MLDKPLIKLGSNELKSLLVARYLMADNNVEIVERKFFLVLITASSLKKNALIVVTMLLILEEVLFTTIYSLLWT
jgi:hypothetical protein